MTTLTLTISDEHMKKVDDFRQAYESKHPGTNLTQDEAISFLLLEILDIRKSIFRDFYRESEQERTTVFGANDNLLMPKFK